MPATQPRTLFDKIWDQHVVASLGADVDLLHIDRHLMHEMTSPQAFTTLEERNLTAANADLTIGATDHCVSISAGRHEDDNPLSRAFAPKMRENCRRLGIRHYDIDDADQGIVHVIGPELGLSLPGSTIVCGDSHTCTNGGLGALAFGIGTSEVAHVLATQCLPQRRPRPLRVRFEGVRGSGVEPKDLILRCIAREGADAGGGHAIEYAGSAVEAMSIEERMTICNLSIEMGAKVGLVGPDDRTFEYVAERPLGPKGALLDLAIEHWRTLGTDPEAAFAREIVVDVDEVAPQISWGISPAHTIAVDGCVPDPSEAPTTEVRSQWRQALEYMALEPGQGLEGLPIHWVFIGSCTNSRLSDLEAAARIARGRRVDPNVRAHVVPGSRSVKRAAEAKGLDRVFREAGFEWGEPGCGLCPGFGGLELGEGERCVSTSNRNFMGRQGKGVRTHLSGAAMAAAAAIRGCIADVRVI